MPVLKAHDIQPYTKDAIVLDLGDIGRQAAKLRLAAETRAAEIVAAAERQAQQLVQNAEGKGLAQGKAEGLQQGLREGREQGRREALEEARAQLAQIQTAWIDVAQQLDNTRKGLALDARQAVLDFALKLAQKVVHRVIEVDPTVVVDQVAGALTLVLRPMDVTVRLNPEDRPLLEQAMPELMAEFPRFEHIAVVADEGVARGGCVVSYGQGEIDADIETQIRRIVDLIVPPVDSDAAPSEK